MTQQTQDVLALRGQDLIGRDGEKLGKIEEIYLDTESNQPEWALITTGLFGSKQSFVPISQASRNGDSVTVPFDKATVKDAPSVEPDGHLSDREEQALYRHYGMEYAGTSTGFGTRDDGDDVPDAVGRDVSGPTTDDAMTRSEEELRVGTA
jgi:sporulation protein YlmC with PRC-barrel domain